MDTKKLLNEVAEILSNHDCVGEAVNFSNANKHNDGAYLAFIAGAHFIVRKLKEEGKL